MYLGVKNILRFLKSAGSAGAIAAVALTGCSGNGSSSSTGPSGGTYNGVYDDVTFNDQSEYQTNFCTVSHTTQFGKLRVHYDNNTTDTHPVYWNNGRASAAVNLIVSIGSLDAGYQDPMHAAVQIWSQELQDPTLMKSANSYFTVVPSDQYDTAGSLVNAYMQPMPDPSFARAIGDFGFQLDSTGTRIQRATITMYTNNEPSDINYRYAAVLHELGHVLGLAHNQDLGSVMFHNADRPTIGGQYCYPYNSNDPTSYPNGSKPPARNWDTDALEGYYDPVLAKDPNGGDGTSCKGSRCYMSVYRSTLGPTSLPLYPSRSLPTLRKAMPPRTALKWKSRPAPYVAPILKTGFPVKRTASRWLRGNEYGLALAGSPEDLILASSLVVQGVVGQPVASALSAADDLVVRPVRLTNMYRHLLGPDENVRAGDVIYVVDAVPSDGGTYIDDPDLPAGPSPILFLKHADPRLNKLFGRPLYAFTKHYVSKWSVDKSGHVHVLSARASRIGVDVNGQTAASFSQRALKKYGSQSLNEKGFIIAMLQNRGMRSLQDVMSYRRIMSAEDGDTLFDRFAHVGLAAKP